jgi:hypothetical protein
MKLYKMTQTLLSRSLLPPARPLSSPRTGRSLPLPHRPLPSSPSLTAPFPFPSLTGARSAARNGGPSPTSLPTAVA